MKPLELVVARLASDIDLFEILSHRADSSTSTEELADITKTDASLLGKFF